MVFNTWQYTKDGEEKRIKDSKTLSSPILLLTYKKSPSSFLLRLWVDSVVVVVPKSRKWVLVSQTQYKDRGSNDRHTEIRYIDCRDTESKKEPLYFYYVILVVFQVNSMMTI